MTQYYTATTLDGFIADETHSLDWLFTRNQDRAGPLNYADFIAEVGALAMGSTTYEWVLAHEFADKDPSDWRWPYEQPTWVFSSRELTAVPDADLRFVRGDVAPVYADMIAAAGGKNVWIVGGGDLAGQFAAADLLALALRLREHAAKRDDVVLYLRCELLGAGAVTAWV